VCIVLERGEEVTTSMFSQCYFYFSSEYTSPASRRSLSCHKVGCNPLYPNTQNIFPHKGLIIIISFVTTSYCCFFKAESYCSVPIKIRSTHIINKEVSRQNLGRDVFASYDANNP
jgi:hypothetical protein